MAGKAMEPEKVLTHFQSLNRTRIERLTELAPKRQQCFFRLLALLFHTNSQILPDPFSDDCPAGIIDFQPSNSQLDEARKLTLSFQLKRRALRHYPLVGLYLINDNGLFNYPRQAQYELWLVHISSINSTQQQALQNKLSIVREWAASLGIAINTRLFAEDTISQRSLSSSELDRFYLNGLIIAGAIPLWWLVPPGVDYQTKSTALMEGYSYRKVTMLDFGELPAASAETLYGDTVGLLDSNLDQGLHYLLPLLHQQYSIDQYPNLSWLCHDYKQAVYQDEIDSLQLDCMILKLKQLERSSATPDIIQLARQSFYLHTKERLSQKVRHPRLSWRRNFVAEYSLSWSWPKEDFKQLDQRSKASFKQCLLEYEITQPIFTKVSETLTHFAQQQQLPINEQHQIINTKLHRNTESAPDIIRHLPIGLLTKNNEEHLYLYRFEQDGFWKISDITLTSTDQFPLHQEDSLLRLLAWAICNHILTVSSRIRVSDHIGEVSISKVKPIIDQLLQSPIASPIIVKNEERLKAPELNHVLLFINLEQRPLARLDMQGLKLSSLQNNPLNYADRGQSLIITIEGLICSSWGEWHNFSHAGITSPLDMLTTLLHWWNPQFKDTTIKCWCPSDTYGATISACLEDLYRDVNDHYHNTPYAGDYFVSIADKFFQLQWQIGLCEHSYLANVSDVFAALSRTRAAFSASRINAPLDPSGVLSTLLPYQTDSQISLFLHNEDRSISIYIIDEFGGLFHQTYSNLTEPTLITNFHRFLTDIKIRNKLTKLQFFRLNHRKKWHISPLSLPSTPSKIDYLPVIIYMDSQRKNAACTIKCGPKLFSGNANDPELFSQVAQLMLKLRHSTNDYPLYITELNIPQHINVSTKDYITQKQRLENLLNT